MKFQNNLSIYSHRSGSSSPIVVKSLVTSLLKAQNSVMREIFECLGILTTNMDYKLDCVQVSVFSFNGNHIRI